MSNHVPNPYESPASCSDTVDLTPRQRATNLIRWSALILMTFAAIQTILFVGAGLVFIAALLVSSQFRRIAENPEPLTPFLTIVSCFFIWTAGWRMRQLRSLLYCRVAAIVACIPYATPFIWFGIPFGIWAVVVLFRKDVAVEFDQLRIVRIGTARLVEETTADYHSA